MKTKKEEKADVFTEVGYSGVLHAVRVPPEVKLSLMVMNHSRAGFSSSLALGLPITRYVCTLKDSAQM